MGQHRALEPATALDPAPGEGEPCRRLELEAVSTAAEPGGLQIGAIAVCHVLTDQLAPGIDVEVHRVFRVRIVLCPSTDAPVAQLIDMPAQDASGCFQTGAS